MRYITRVAIAFDTLCNVILGNRLDETMSTHAAINKDRWPWSWLHWCLDTAFPKHCEIAEQHDAQRAVDFSQYVERQEDK